MPLDIFQKYMLEASKVPDIVEIAISTRPDCIREDYLDVLNRIRETTGIQIAIELGLQTVNYHTLKRISRGHTLAEYIDAVLRISRYGYDICTHVILNLPGDEMDDSIETAKILSALPVQIVKAHSLYIAKDTRLCDDYENGTISLCEKEEYLNRLIAFLEHLNPDIAVERLFSRIPEKDAVFCNWNTSWWKLRDELLLRMEEQNSFQGKLSGWSGIAFIGQQRIGGPYFGCKYYFFKYKSLSKEKTFKYRNRHFWGYIYLSSCDGSDVSDRKAHFCL